MHTAVGSRCCAIVQQHGRVTYEGGGWLYLPSACRDRACKLIKYVLCTAGET